MLRVRLARSRSFFSISVALSKSSCPRGSVSAAVTLALSAGHWPIDPGGIRVDSAASDGRNSTQPVAHVTRVLPSAQSTEKSAFDGVETWPLFVATVRLARASPQTWETRRRPLCTLTSASLARTSLPVSLPSLVRPIRTICAELSGCNWSRQFGRRANDSCELEPVRRISPLPG